MWRAAIGDVLLLIGVLAVLLSCIGLIVARDTYDRLHYLGPATSLGPVCIALATVAYFGLGQAGIKALLVAAVLLVTGPVVTHATARATRLRGSRDVPGGGDER